MQKHKLNGFYALRNSISSYSHHQYTYFHSTPVSLAKWKNKWNSDADSGERPSKNYVRYAIRQKRSDAKKALKDLLYHSGCSQLPFQDVGRARDTDRASSWDNEEADDSYDSSRKSRSKKSRRSSRAGKGRPRKWNFADDSGTVFEATFGTRSYTWEEPNFPHSSPEFEWRDTSKWARNNRRRVWDSTSETDEDDKSQFLGSYSDRITLGLPPTGRLKIQDVKTAFRSLALKWHPDKHQGPSQALAEEKFKQCVDSYNCLCKALS